MTRMRTSSGISSAAKSMVWISKPASSNIDIIDAEVVSPCCVVKATICGVSMEDWRIAAVKRDSPWKA